MTHRQRIGHYLSITFVLSILSLIWNTEEIGLPRAKLVSNTIFITTPTPNTTPEDKKAVVEQKGWWNDYVTNISRVYTPSNNGTTTTTTPYGWCISSQEIPLPKFSDPPSNASISGFIYIKNPKASSSTGQGITANIAHHVGRQKFPLLVESSSNLKNRSSSSSSLSVVTGDDVSEVVEVEEEVVVPCTYYSHHEFAGHKGHGRLRQSDTSLLWTTVRHPAARDLSHMMYFRVRNGMEPTEENLIRSLSTMRQGTQTRYLLPSLKWERQVKPEVVRTRPKRVALIIQNYIINYYDFIGVTERMEDSLAVMTLLWGLDPTDVIVLSSKQSGGYSPRDTRVGYYPNGTKQNTSPGNGCVQIPKVNSTKAIDTFFQSANYQNGHADFLLYHAAVKSLDRTIDTLGRSIVQERVNQIQKLQQLAELQCSNIAQFPCSVHGELQSQRAKESCYTLDAGCGYQCVDKALLAHRTIPLLHS